MGRVEEVVPREIEMNLWNKGIGLGRGE